MSDFLSVQGLVAGYGDALVLHDVSLALREGETLALLGRNGTGKTTLINSLVGATRAHRGLIHLNSIPLHEMASHERAVAGLGWVPQERNIFRSLTVQENLTCTARTGRWTLQRIYRMFPRLEERKNILGTQLSGGEQQMLAIGRALALNPKLLLLDEPTEGLAPIIVDQLLDALRQITREEGLSAIIVEQNPQLVLPMCDQAIVLNQGAVAHVGKAESLLADTGLMEELLGVGIAVPANFN